MLLSEARKIFSEKNNISKGTGQGLNPGPSAYESEVVATCSDKLWNLTCFSNATPESISLLTNELSRICSVTTNKLSFGGASGTSSSFLWLDVPTGAWPASLQLSVLWALPQPLIEGLSLPAIA